MTTGALLLSMSSLLSGTALDHLQHISVGGEVQWSVIPATSITADINMLDLDADITQVSLTADVAQDTITADITQDGFTADLQQPNLEGNL